MLQALLEKIAPHWAGLLAEETIPCPGGWGGAYSLEAGAGRLAVRGDCALSRAVALRMYLEQACGIDILSAVPQWAPITIKIPPDFRIEGLIPAAGRGFFTPLSYACSPCWWDAERWEAEVDLLALYGVNRPLLLTGSEYAWYNALRDHGIGREYALDTMSGPCFWPRQLMGQLAALYAPVDPVYLKSRAQLGRRVADRMRDWGMRPILPGFSPLLSHKLTGLIKGAKTIHLPEWNGFTAVHLLEPDCPVFASLGESYHRRLESTLGEAGGFWIDPFAERELPEIVARRVPAVLDALRALCANYTADAKIFYDAPIPLPPPPGHTALRGDAAGAAACVAERGSSIRCGAEEPESNPLLLTLQLEALTRCAPIELGSWLQRYASNRYGNEHLAQALELLCQSCCAVPPEACTLPPDSSFCRRPNTVPEPAAPNGAVGIPYDNAPVIQAARIFLAERHSIAEGHFAAYRYDLCDVLRQAMSNRAGEFYARAMEGYRARDARLFERSANDFLRLLESCDRLLLAGDGFSLPAHLKRVRQCAKMDAERNNFELAVLAQHSIYAGTGRRKRESHLLHGIDWREWGGLLGTLHYKRWQMFFALLARSFNGKPLSLETKRKPLGRSEFETGRFLSKMADMERQWLKTYVPKEPNGEDDAEGVEEIAEGILAGMKDS